ncbi:MAG: SdrD B-like domain-containing protein, partial [Saprospiraceae bacterium]
MENLADDFCDIQLTIVNEGDCHLEVYEWLSTGDVYRFDLEAGESQTVTTQDGAMWRVTNGDWNNLVYDEHITISGCSNRTWTTYPTYCNAPMTGWNSTCSNGESVEIIGKGINNAIPATLNFPNSSNIYKAVVEVVYKGGNPGDKITVYDDEGNPFSANREQPSGLSSNVWVYRAMMPNASSVSYYESSQENRAQTMVAYLFRNTTSPSIQTGVFTYVSGHNNFQTMNFNIPATAVTRDITLKIPMSELTDDGRYLLLRGVAGGVSAQHIVYGPSSTLGCCLDIIELTLPNVPAATSQVTLEIDTRHNQNGQTVNGQSYVLAGAVEVSGSCDDPCVGSDCDTECELNNHGPDADGGERLVWFEIESLGDEKRTYSVVNNSSKIVEYIDGTALITGQVEQLGNISNKWEYHVRLVNKRNWSEWSALGRDYKPGVAGTDHTTWNYYEVDNSDSYFTGLGGHAGQSLTITHNPGSFEFGFQLGTGANLKNTNYGLSGWFLFDGAFDGHGDFNGNLDNCGLDSPMCLEFDASKSDANFGQNNGKIVVTNLDEAANYRLFLNGNQIAENAGTVFIVTDLSPGTYTVLAKGYDSQWGQECEQSFTLTITEVGGNSDCSITPPFDLDLTCTDDLTPDFIGYPIINCDAGGSCDRMAGYHELDYQIFDVNTTSEWSFGQGWQIGSGCTPSCGLAPNAFIDFTNFDYAYTRNLTSPVFDACGMDNVQIDYCIRSDLFTNDYNNAPIQFLDVQYKIGNGNWVTLNTYQSENGATNDFNEDDVNIPGAADNQLRIRFRARGNGGSFTLGGWGVDRLRVEGNSSGSTATLNPGDYNVTYNDNVSGTDCPQVITRTWTATPNNSAQNCSPSILVQYDMDGCTSFGSDGSNFDYSEFTPSYPNNGNCVNVNATGVYRQSGQHSCISGQGGSTAAACFGVDGLTSFQDNSNKAIRFEVTLNPSDAGRLTALKFHEWAPDHFSHLSGNSGTNNYPQKYGVRVLKNGVQVFKQTNINTTQSWSLESFDFSNNSDFEILSTTTFQFELLSYDAVGNGGQISAWDIDNIRIEGCCGSGVGTDVLTATQIITVDDQTAPDVMSVPADVTIQCDETAPIVAPTFMDICDADLDIVFAENVQAGLCDDNTTLVRTWTATDDCGNARTATQLVTRIDTTDPILQTAPANMAAECDEVPAPANLTATDNCDNNVLVTFNENRINGTCDDNYTLERIWIATDNCGNTVQQTQTITVADQTPPVFALLADITLECSDNLTPPNPVVSDNCDVDVTVILNDEFRTDLSCTDNYTLTRVWTATDNCGNQSTYTQVATIEDTTPPSISAPADDTVLCDDVPAPATVGANDNCDNDVTVTFAEVRTDGNCPNNYTLTRTWTATDNCGNVSSDSQVLTVIDATGPEILDVPASVTVECDEFAAAPTLLIQDNCDANATIELNEEMQLGVCDDNYTVIRTWTATDVCGNTTTAIQVVTVTDTTSPELAGIPADATVECDAIPASASPTASDNCDNDVTIEYQEISSQTTNGSCTDNSYTLTRIWKATDNCGNVDIQQQVITVEDTTDPVLGSLPVDQTVECDDVPTPATLTANDNCDGNVDITFSETSTKTNNGACTDDTYVITRTWVATDNCGNTDTYSQIINVQDTTDPILANIPANFTINVLPAPAVATPTATDNCDGNVAIDFVETSGEGCIYEIIRTWTATDNCGNQDVRTQTITVELDPQAGTLDIDDSLVCLAPAGNGNISATPNGDANVPVGFDVIYILTKGNGLVIEQINSTPNFTALTAGDYTIHTLLYVSDSNDPNYLDLSTVVLGTTTGFDVNALLQQGGGLLCGSLDVAGARVAVDNCDAKIGNMVFEDINANGIMDAGEPGIEGVIVNLEGTTADGEAVFASQMTDADGKYSFENLAPGDYKLTFIKPLGYEATYANEGDDALDSDADPISGMTVFENLESGEDNDTYDAGFYKTGKIGDMVFVDTNANGIMDLGEAGIPNVVVILTGTTGNGTPVSLTTTTDADGKYIFDDLAPGSYKLTFVTPNGYVTTYPNEGGNDAADSDVDPTTNMTEFVTIESGEENLTLDAGYYEYAKIGNFVFEDKNANGIQDAGESGISNVEILLTGTTGNGTTISLTTTTDGNGLYDFDNLVPGNYKLTFTSPTDFKATYANEGGDDELDSDADPISGMTVFENLESGEDNDTYDAGFFKAGKIGDMVFVDKNANGIMDLGEAGIPNVEVTLTGTTGNGTLITLTTTTDADGKYIFDDLAPGTYKLTFNTPTGFVTTYPNEGGDDTADSDVDPTTNMTEFVTIESGEENLTLDAGYYEPAKIGDMAFVDDNANGIMEAGEPGIQFVNVVLEGFTGNNTPVTLTTQTDVDGKYLFDNLVPGAYKLTFTADPLYQATNKDLGGDDALDSDIDPITGMTDFEFLESGETNLTYDAGYYVFGKIGDFVWLDCNKDGMQSPGEKGIADVKVRLFGTNGFGLPVQAMATTDADGKYEFDGLIPGVYLLTIDLPTTPTGYAFTTANQGDDAFDSDFDGGATDDITITSGLIVTDVDGGLIDDEAPVFAGVPADVTVECDAIPAPATPTATDNLDTDVTITFVESTTQSGNTSDCQNNTFTITRTWTAIDNCGNVSTATQVISVEDTTDPILLDVPADVTVECDAIPVIGTPSATDNCDVNVTITFNEVRIDGNCEDNYTIERTWTATDNCGNDISQTQTITVQDTTDPELIGVPADVIVECDLVPTPASPQAIDNCDTDVDIIFNEVRTDGNCVDNYTLTRTWIATDNCGNTDTKVQVITVQDTTDPNIYDIPANVTVECDAIPAASTAPFANDNCDDDVAITFEEVRVDGNCEDNYTIERTWIATDNCGNNVSGTQTITVQDTTDPILAGIPADETVECNAIPNPASPTATDNCDADVDIAYEEVRTDGNCADNYTLTRTWTATDNCGNTDVQVQVITVQDTTDPELIGVPANVTVECDLVPTPATPEAIDNCDADVTIDYVEIRTDGACVDTYTLTRTWTATDNCGNTDVQVQVIQVQDTTDPNIYDIPANIIVECDAVPAPSTAPFANDNCDDDVAIIFVEVRVDGNCEDNYTLERTWTATDNCGNDVSQTQIITVQDTTDPELIGVPANVTVECDLVPAPATPQAIDNCDADVDISFNEVKTDGQCEDNYILTRTWTATDNCGNQDVKIQYILVQDTNAPSIYDIPANVTVECDAIPAASTAPFANDNCDTDVAITFAEVRVDGNCEDNYTLERTWTAT